VDKLTAVPRRRLGRLVGSLASEEVKALNRAIFVFLGLSQTEVDKGSPSRYALETVHRLSQPATGSNWRRFVIAASSRLSVATG
jgi:hypothetical protein